MDTCKSIYAAMRLDFGDRFMKQFEDKNDARSWINRLYSRLGNAKPAVVVDAYDRAVKEKRPYVPTLDDIVGSATALQAERSRVAERLEYVNAPRLPAGSGIAGYVEYLDAHAEGDLARGCIAMMREIVGRTDAKTRAEQEERLTKAIKAHDKLLAMAPIRLRAYAERRECGLTGCDRPGTMAHSTNGEGPWFCVEHFRT
jgi:hypothetical protein